MEEKVKSQQEMYKLFILLLLLLLLQVWQSPDPSRTLDRFATLPIKRERERDMCIQCYNTTHTTNLETQFQDSSQYICCTCCKRHFLYTYIYVGGMMWLEKVESTKVKQSCSDGGGGPVNIIIYMQVLTRTLYRLLSGYTFWLYPSGKIPSDK